MKTGTMTTNRLLASVLLLGALLAPSIACAQGTLLQGGPTTSGHAPMYSTSGGAGSQPVVVDSGPASGGQAGLGLSEILQVNRTTSGTGQNGAHTCFYSAPATTAAGGYVLCLDALAGTGGLISFSNFGTAPQLPLNIVVNGSTLNLTNTLPQGQIFIGNVSNVATAQSVSGDCVISIAGVLTCTKTNGVAFGYFATGTDAANLTGTVASGRITGAYSGLIGTGTLTSGATGAGFTVNLTTSTLTGILGTTHGGWGADISGSSGIALLTAGTPSFLSSTGSGNVVRATGATIASPSVSGASLSTSSWSGGTITGLPTCTSSGDACPKSYIDSVAQGQTPASPVRLATAAVLPQSPTYANGASGVGATLTAGSNAAIVVDGVSASLNDRVLVSQQAAQLQNGIYTVTTVGSGGAAWVLTRATDADQAAELVNGLTTAVQAGSTLTGSKWTLTQPSPITVGTTALPFVETSIPTSSVWSASGSDIYNNNAGSVGIGTGAVAMPGLLTISANTDGRIFFTRTAVSNSFLGLGTTFDVWNGANVDMRFGTNNAEGMRLTAGGLLGLGIAAPSGRLDVQSTGSGTPINTMFRSGGNTGSDSPIVYWGRLNGTVDIAIFGNSSGARIKSSGSLAFHTSDVTISSGGQRMTIDTSGLVGIGTTTPGTQLEVANAASMYIKHTITSSANDVGDWYFDGTNSAFAGLLGQTGCGTGSWAVATGGGCRMVITSTGRVGIGTTTPVTGAYLQVSNSGSFYLTVQDPPLQQAICYGFGAGNCETDAVLSHLIYTAGASTTGAAIRGEVLMQKASATAIGVSGISSNLGTGVASELVGVIGVTDWNGAGSGNAVWAITAGTNATAGLAGAFAATNRASTAPAWGLLMNFEGAATASFVTAIDVQGFTSFGLVLRNSLNAGFPIYITNSVGSVVYSVNASGTVFSASDARLKRDMGAIPDGALDLVAKLTPRNFSFLNDASARKDAGFFAQEVRDVIGEAVESDSGGSLLMSQGPLIAYAVKAIQELKADNDNLRDCLRSAECRRAGPP